MAKEEGKEKKKEKKEKKDKKEGHHKEKKEKKEKKEHKEHSQPKEAKAEVEQKKKELKEEIEEDETSEASIETPKPSTANTELSVTEDEDDEEAVDADELLEDETKLKEIEERKQKANLKDKESNRLRLKRQDSDYVDSDNPWYVTRDCLLLVLEARTALKQMIELRLKQERIKHGELSVQEIQALLKSQQEEEETDWVTEIQELKRNLVNEVRRNHHYERELTKLDKRIALLIKNRGNIQDVLAEKHGAKKKHAASSERAEIFSDPRKMEGYQNLFYLLQTEPNYLANLVYLMKADQMESFLDTVILTLYGDAFSPREEYLILKLFQSAIQREMTAISNVSDFLKADSVVPKMVITYNRRKQGLEFLKNVLGPILKSVIAKDTNLEVKPSMVYQAFINEEEIQKGEKSNLPRNLTEDQIMERQDVREIINKRFDDLKSICDQFFDGIVRNLSKLPYGIRWICKQIRKIAQEKFKNSNEDDILKVTGYFVYYRFINLAIVTPDAFEIIDRELQPVARKNLVSVARVLQNLFNLSLFVAANDKWMMPMNEWLKSKMESVRDYFTDLAEVADPEDYLQVDKYMELFTKTKPVIIISLHEIAQTHSYLLSNLDKLAKDKDDPLRQIVTDLGEAPVIAKEDDREVQLTLTNRFKQNVEEEISSSSSLYAETKELVISVFRHIPVIAEHDQTLVSILTNGKKSTQDTQLIEQIDKIFENMKVLEADGLISKSDNYAKFLRDIALEVANRAEVREQQRKEIKRLNQTLRNLRKHQKYLTDQITQYNEYLQDARMKHYQAHQKKSKKKKTDSDNPNKIGPFKFTYSALQKKGVIIDSEVPTIARKKCTFEISSEAVGVFEVVAKIGGATVDKITLELDDLLERNYNNITRVELEQVVLDVNMTIHLINKFFLK